MVMSTTTPVQLAPEIAEKSACLSRSPLSLDVETGGLNPKKCALLSIGAVSDAGEFYVEIRPTKRLEASEEALEINSLDLESLRKNGIPEAKALKMFFEFAELSGDVTILGQNPTFDAGFIRAACKRHGIICPLGHRAIDLHSVAVTAMCAYEYGYPVLTVEKMPSVARTDVNLDSILEYVGTEKRPGYHNALEDARLAFEA